MDALRAGSGRACREPARCEDVLARCLVACLSGVTVLAETPAPTGVPLLEMEGATRALVTGLGPERSKALYLHFEPGEHPELPAGKHDDTHFSELGARQVAVLAAREMVRLRLPCVRHLDLERLDPAASGVAAWLPDTPLVTLEGED